MSNSKGVAVLFAKNVVPKNLEVTNEGNGRVLYVNFEVNGNSFLICNVYAPNEDDPQFFANIFQKLQESEQDHVLCMGDFNVYLNEKNDKKGGKASPSKTREVINAFLTEAEWIDAWRAFNPTKFGFTWKRQKPIVMHRLDYIIAPLSTFKCLSRCEIEPTFFTDHSAVQTEFIFESNIRGPGLWKFNTSHLANVELVQRINETLEKAEDRYKMYDPLNKWERTKIEMQTTAVAFAYEQAAKRKQHTKEWNAKLKSAHKKLSMINLSAHNAIQLIEKVNLKIDVAKEELNKITVEKVKGAMLRVKARWMSLAERGSKYFHSLEKRNAKSKSMNKVYNERNQITENPTEILRVQSEFYHKLYTSDKEVNCQIDCEPEAKISEIKKSKLNDTISVEEIQEAIKGMARNKSPGSDGYKLTCTYASG